MTPVDKVLENCRIVTTKEILDADIAIDQGKIVQIARSAHMPSANEKIDMDGRIVIPGCIDVHVHFRDPGLTHKGDFATESRAAVFGGVTTVFDMPNTVPKVDCREALEEKRNIIKEKSCVDYALYAELTDDNWNNIPDAFAYKGYLDSGNLCYESLQIALGNLQNKIVSVHAEDYDTIDPEKYTKDPRSHSLVRPLEAEVVAIRKVLELDLGTNQVHFCHVTTGEGLGLILNSDKNVSCEACTHHLFLELGHYGIWDNFIKVNPSIKSADNVKMLWANLNRIGCIATDHAPHTREEKEQGTEKAPSGIPGVETMLPLLINSVNEGKLMWQDVVRLTSHGPMEIFGLQNKGTIEVGKDADLVIIDNAQKWIIDASELHCKCGWTPYEGREIAGRIEKVFLRGELIIDSGEFLGKEGYGEEI